LADIDLTISLNERPLPGLERTLNARFQAAAIGQSGPQDGFADATYKVYARGTKSDPEIGSGIP
jgi:hypothetical protein